MSLPNKLGFAHLTVMFLAKGKAIAVTGSGSKIIKVYIVITQCSIFSDLFTLRYNSLDHEVVHHFNTESKPK